MFEDRILAIGRQLGGRLDAYLIQGALNYVDHKEEALALEILCDHIAEYEVRITEAEHNQLLNLARDMGMDVAGAPYRYLIDLVG